MEELRYIESDHTYADFSTSLSPALERALEKGESKSTIVLNIFRAGSFTIGVLEDPEKSMDLDYCRKANIVVRRRQNPGGAVWGPEDGVMLVYYLDTEQTWVPLKTVQEGFRRSLTDLAEVFKELFSIPAVYRPLNDVEVEGRKLVATSARLEKGILTMRLLINLVPTDRDILTRAITMPIEKIQDKKIKEAGARFTCLEAEIGRKVTSRDLTEMVNRTISKTFGEAVRITPGRLTAIEQKYADEYQKTFTSDEWFYANSERVRFKNKPSEATISEGRHKAPAGLIRITLLIRRNMIQDLIITGDFHPSPHLVIQDMEANLRGKACDPEGVRAELEKIFDRPGVEIPGTTVDDFLSAFKRALA